MKHANRHASLSSGIQSTYASVRLPNNYAWARLLTACGHHILFVCWIAVAGNRARGDHENMRLGWKIEFRLDEHWESRYNGRRVWTWISVLSSFTARRLRWLRAWSVLHGAY